MSSPEVYDDALALLRPYCAAYAIPLAIPNELNAEIPQPWDGQDDPKLWAAVEFDADTAGAFELGYAGLWEETGDVIVHVMAPVHSGARQAMVLRKALVNLFRLAQARPVTYRVATLDPGGDDEAGNWFRLTARIAYSFTDQPEGPTP